MVQSIFDYLNAIEHFSCTELSRHFNYQDISLWGLFNYLFIYLHFEVMVVRTLREKVETDLFHSVCCVVVQ